MHGFSPLFFLVRSVLLMFLVSEFCFCFVCPDKKSPVMRPNLQPKIYKSPVVAQQLYHMSATTRYNFVRLKATTKSPPQKSWQGGDLPPSSSQRLTGMRMCWKEKIQWQSVTNGLRKEHVLRSPFLFLDKVLHFFLLIVICNSLNYVYFIFDIIIKYKQDISYYYAVSHKMQKHRKKKLIG